jgi:diguanylate cyclase (GGDEF)-like protein
MRDLLEMPAADFPPDEAARLTELRSLDLLDSAPEERFDQVTRLAQRLFGVPVALVSLIDDDRQWFKSRQGVEAAETARDVAFCGHAILGDDIFQVPDAMVDPRFRDNPLVLADPGVRFYASCPIVGPSGAKLGSLCIIDRAPRGLSDQDRASLRDLADIGEQEIAARQMSTVDQLTGLSNRHGFELHASKILDVCRRRGTSATLLYLDLDGLKSANDQFGHAVGDEVLTSFAAVLGQALRTSDVVARLGGDEFAVLLAEAHSGDDPVARLRAAIDEHNEGADAAHQLAASIGVAYFDPAVDTELGSLVRRADAAMYADKRSSGISGAEA